MRAAFSLIGEPGAAGDRSRIELERDEDADEEAEGYGL